MKKLLLLMLLLAPLFADAQGRVYRKNSRATKDLLFSFDGEYIIRVSHDEKPDKKVGKYNDGYIYTISSDGTTKPVIYFNGKYIYWANDMDKAFAMFDGKYVYYGDRADASKIIGCMVNKKYYRGDKPDPDKLLMNIEGEIPICILLFLNVG